MNNLTRDGDGYLEDHIVGGARYTVRYSGLCATPECLALGANIDAADPRTQAYAKAVGVDLIDKVKDGVTIVTLANPISFAAKAGQTLVTGIDIIDTLSGNIRTGASLVNQFHLERYLKGLQVAEGIRGRVVELYGRATSGDK